MKLRRIGHQLSLLVPLLACNQSSSTPDGESGGSSDEASESGEASESSTDASGGDGDGDADHCADVGYEALAWDDSASAAAFGQLAPDMAVNTLREPFTLSAAWGGCSVFTLVPYHPNFSLSNVETLIDDGAREVALEELESVLFRGEGAHLVVRFPVSGV